MCRGAFKFRGACNAVLSLSDDEARKGVLTHSRSDSTAPCFTFFVEKRCGICFMRR